MEKIVAIAVVLAFTVPAFAQEGLADRLKALEAKVMALEAKKSMCDCPCGCATTGVCTCGKTATAVAPVQYQQVCENGVCRLVPYQATQQTFAQPQYQSMQSGCANGNCGAPARGFFRRR